MANKIFPTDFAAIASFMAAYLLPCDDGTTNKTVSGTQLQSFMALTFNALMTWRDEGTDLAAAGVVDKVDFVGAGVSATYAAGKVTVTIPGASSTPTGTGLRKVVAGVEAGAAALLVDADVAASAAIGMSKLDARVAPAVSLYLYQNFT